MSSGANLVVVLCAVAALAACSSDESAAPKPGVGGSGGLGSGGAGQGGASAGGSGAVGGGGAGASGGGGGTIEPEGLAVVFPPLASLTPADELSVRGTSDASYDITAVTVGSTAATSGDGFATWQADVPLVVGPQSLGVSATGTMMPMHPALEVEGNDAIEGPDDMVFDAASGRAYLGNWFGRFYSVDVSSGQATLRATMDITDGMASCAVSGLPGARSLAYDADADELLVMNTQCLVTVNMQTGVRTLVTDAYPSSFVVRDLALDATNDRALVLDYDAVYAVDMSNGAFSVIADSVTGSGPALDETTVMAPDLSNDRVLVLQGGSSSADFALIAVDLTSGDRTTLASAGLGAGPAPYDPEAAAYDPAGNRTLVGDNFRVLAIDHATGDRTVLSDGNNAGPSVNYPRGMALDAANGRVLEADFNSQVLAIDLTTGDRSYVYDFVVGTGASLSNAIVAVHPTSGDVYAAPLGIGLVRVDRWGNRTVVSGGTSTPVGTGPSIAQIRGAAFHPPNDEVLVVGGFGLVSVDLATGDRTELSGPNVGSGPAFSLPTGVAVHASGSPIWVSDVFANGLFAVDRATGARTVVANNSSVGTGPNFSYDALDYDGTNLFVVGMGSVLAIDPATGDRTVVSSAAVGSGPNLTLGRLALAPSGDTIYTVYLGRVMAVDVATGDRSNVSGPGIGRGPFLGYSFVDVDSNGIVWLSGDAGYSIGALDPQTGDRVVAGK